VPMKTNRFARLNRAPSDRSSRSSETTAIPKVKDVTPSPRIMIQ
jgi:hypothetical protein